MDSVDAVSEDLELSPRLVSMPCSPMTTRCRAREAILQAVTVRGASIRAIEKELHLDLITRVNEQLAGQVRHSHAAKAPVGVDRKSRGRRPSTASGGPRPDRRFKPDGKKRKGSDGITTAPSAREHVPEGTASLRSIAEAHQEHLAEEGRCVMRQFPVK